MNGAKFGLTDNLTYASPRIFERRLRILEEAHRLITESGLENFRMRELCKRASVAPHTIYKAFGSKERLIALALRHQFESFSTKHPLKYPKRTLEGALERVIVGHATMLSMKEYVKAVTSIYFSLTADEELRQAASYNVILTLLPWMMALHKQGCLREGVTPETVVDLILRLKFAITLGWSRDSISDDEFLDGKIFAVLSVSAGLTCGAGYDEVNDYLTDFLGARQRFDTFRDDVSQKAVGIERRRNPPEHIDAVP